MFIGISQTLEMIRAFTLDAERLINQGQYDNAMFALNKIAEYNEALRDHVDQQRFNKK
jgi:hypothetical protein